MGIMIDEAERLLRKKWGNAQELSEEIYSILTARGPVMINSPVQIATNSKEPALSIVNNFGDGSGPTLNVTGGSILNGDTVIGGSMFTYQKDADDYVIVEGSTYGGSFYEGDQHLTEVYMPEIPGWDPSVFDGLNDFLKWVNEFDFKPTQIPDGPDPDPEEDPGGVPPGDGGGGVTSTGLVGTVVSGTGSSYRVDLYPNGFNRPSSRTVTVDIPNIASDETIPGGTRIVGIIGMETGQIVNNEIEVVYYFQPPVWMD